MSSKPQYQIIYFLISVSSPYQKKYNNEPQKKYTNSLLYGNKARNILPSIVINVSKTRLFYRFV